MLDILNRLDTRTEVRVMHYLLNSPIYKVYRLIDPRNNEVRYIGVTVVLLKNRLAGHLSEKPGTNRAKKVWVEELALEGLRPLIELISEHKTKEEGMTAENNNILAGLKAGQRLFNKERKLMELGKAPNS